MSSGDDMGGIELKVRVTYRGEWKRGCNMMSVEGVVDKKG